MTGSWAGARLGLAVDPDPLFADLIAAVAAGAGELGLETRDVGSAEDAAGVDRLLLVGRPGRYRELLGASGGPPRTVWVGEPLPPIRSGQGTAASRSAALRRLRPLGRLGRRVPLPGSLDRRRVRLATDRLLEANLRELEEAILAGTTLVVTSRDRGATVAARGLPVAVVPFGYHARHAGPLTPVMGHDRDVPLLMIGTRGTHTRRAREVTAMARSRAMRDLRIVDGVWGQEREALLRRTRVVVDVHRVLGNFVGMRLLLAIAAGAVVVTEPMTDPFPFIPGVHFVQAPLADLATIAADLAADDARRVEMVDAGQALLEGELAMRRSLRRVLDAGPAA